MPRWSMIDTDYEEGEILHENSLADKETAAKPEIHLCPAAIPGGRPGVMARTEDGHPIQWYYGRMDACIKRAELRWPDHKIIAYDLTARAAV